MEAPENLYYTKSHEWVRLEDDGTATVGITDYAQENLGDVVHVELPAIGTPLVGEGEAGVVESVKSASDLYAPLDGEVAFHNAKLVENPGLINESPYEEGWLYRMNVKDAKALDELLSSANYVDYCYSSEDRGGENESEDLDLNQDE